MSDQQRGDDGVNEYPVSRQPPLDGQLEAGQVEDGQIEAGQIEAVKRESARRTRRSFVVGAVSAAAGYGILRWVNNSALAGRLQSVLRGTLQTDAAVSRALFDERGLSPTYPLSRARPLRLNGVVGLARELQRESWRLQMAGVAQAEHSPHYVQDITAWEYRYSDDAAPVSQPGGDLKSSPQAAQAAQAQAAQKPSIADRFNSMTQEITHKRRQGDAEAGASANALDIGTPGLLLSMHDLMQLPRVELVTEFKCIEGWSEVAQWSGFRLRDLIEAYPPEKIVEKGRSRDPRYVYMETPDGDYYCGYDMSAARHPQSLLVTEMGGQPLTQEHGAPLRLHMPIKYGYKQIKRIGLIAYTDSKPDDFWTKLGYDWYAGL